MRTSNYERSGKHPNAVSIAGRAPSSYKGREYKKLAPKKWFFLKYKQDHDEAAYIRHYFREVLDKLDPQHVYEELGEDAILLCWESINSFLMATDFPTPGREAIIKMTDKIDLEDL